MEEILYAKVIDGTDNEGLRYTALAIAPKTEFDTGEGNLYRTSEEAFEQICDIFGEDKLFGELTHYITFIYEDAQDVRQLVERAEALASQGNVSLAWFNDEFAEVLTDEYTQVASDDEIDQYVSCV